MTWLQFKHASIEYSTGENKIIEMDVYFRSEDVLMIKGLVPCDNDQPNRSEVFLRHRDDDGLAWITVTAEPKEIIDRLV